MWTINEIQLQHLDTVIKPSPISEGATEIQINIHLARELTWQHDTCGSRRHHEWPPFVMTIKESGRVLHHPSACLPHDNSMGIRWWTVHLSWCTSIRQGKVSSNLAIIEAAKFAGPNKSRMRQYIVNACYTWPLINTGGDYHLQSFEHENRPLSPFPSSIFHFPLVAPPGLILNQLPYI
jgi:hypothetical protein